MPKFSLNLSLVLKDTPFLEAIDRAAALGFGAIEFWWPGPAADPAEIALKIKAAGLEVALFNFDAGDMAAGDRGLLNDPDRQDRLRSHVPVALKLAQALGCTRLNALAGHWRPGVPRAEQLAFAAENLAWIADRARPAGITVLVEPVNNLENGDYLVPTVESALELLDLAGRANTALQFDTYHLQRMQGDLTTRLRRHAARIGHVQLADSPSRHEPGTGELNFAHLLRTLEESGYAGYLGLEYKPSVRVEESLTWLPADRRGLLPLSALRLTGLA
mgnify:CR=1 FL=1